VRKHCVCTAFASRMQYFFLVICTHLDVVKLPRSTGLSKAFRRTVQARLLDYPWHKAVWRCRESIMEFFLSVDRVTAQYYSHDG